MATLPDAGRYPPQCQLSAPQSQIHDLDEVAGTLPSSKSPRIVQPTERRLEREIGSLSHQPIELPQDHPGSRNCRQLRLQWRQPTGDQVCIDEVNHARIFGKISTRKRRLPSAIRSRNDDTARFSLPLLHLGMRAPVTSPIAEQLAVRLRSGGVPCIQGCLLASAATSSP